MRPWLGEGRRGAWTAALLRTGGLRDVPYLVEDGLAVGGAAAGLGVDIPLLNLTGPATATGLLLSRATANICAEGRGFDREALLRHYLGPLQQSRYWGDLAFLQRWPTSLRKSRALFDSGVDLALDSSAVWARSRRWLPWKLFAWLGILAPFPWRQMERATRRVPSIGLRFPSARRDATAGADSFVARGASTPSATWCESRGLICRRAGLRLHYRAADEEGPPAPCRSYFAAGLSVFVPCCRPRGECSSTMRTSRCP